MPDIRDFLPPPPWEGPPILRGWGPWKKPSTSRGFVELGITRKLSTGEYRVYWEEDGKDDESKAYYTDDWIDAMETLFNVITHNESAGIPTKISQNKLTTDLLRKYNKSFGGMIP